MVEEQRGGHLVATQQVDKCRIVAGSASPAACIERQSERIGFDPRDDSGHFHAPGARRDARELRADVVITR